MKSQSGNKANKEIKHHPYIVSSYCSIILQPVSDGLYEARPKRFVARAQLVREEEGKEEIREEKGKRS